MPFAISKGITEQGGCLDKDELIINVKQIIFNMNIQQLALQGKHIFTILWLPLLPRVY